MAARLRTAALAVLLPGLLGTPAHAAPDWTLAPAPGGGRPYVYAEGAPGAVLEDRLTLTNPGTAPLTVRLGTGAWVALAATTVTVPPRTRADIPLTVTVPPGTPPGERTTAVTAAATRPAGRTAAVRLHLRITGPAVAALSVEDVSTEGPTVRYTLVNRGNTVLRPRVELSADGLLGTAHRRTARTTPAELRPGHRVTRTETWGERPFLDSVSVQVTATAGPGTRAEATASTTLVSRPALAAALTGTVVLLFVGMRRLRRSRTRPRATEANP
ncbi:hypothetical protein [Streptomyces tsukubensis]|uniref:hypothetical protein n=1 Tax=Streptomyces tsukubensis TaxID=83656 RepID=UPI00102E2B27|nr:hypothetical protein [Streptomyces tsukubensis]TAI42555.1 hypothetical protein EWI31_19105 [Streptomyces tsukubensis]